MNNKDIANALRLADWSGVSVGNKAIIQSAIDALDTPIAYRVRLIRLDNGETVNERLSHTPVKNSVGSMYRVDVTPLYGSAENGD